MEYDSNGLAYDKDLEQAFLGAILFKPNNLKTVLGNVKLTEEVFYFEKNRNVLNTIFEIANKGTEATDLLVSSHLNGTVPKGYISSLLEAYTAQDPVAQAERLVELQRWRDRRMSALSMLEATKERDIEAYTKAKNLLNGDEIIVNSMSEPKQLGERFKNRLKDKSGASFSLPHKKLNERMAGGLRRKQFTVIGGWSSHGKSVVIDEWLEHFTFRGAKCHLYINEMGEEDRTARCIARHSEIPFNTLVHPESKLTPEQEVHIDKLVEDGAPYFSITDASGFSLNELIYDIRAKEFDVVGIDILHGFDYESENEIAKISRHLKRVAMQANCHVIATVHLNEFRCHDIIRPRPVLRDIRGSGMIKNDTDNVFFIHREQDPSTGDPLAPALLYSSKVRNGNFCSIPLMLYPGTFKFIEESAEVV